MRALFTCASFGAAVELAATVVCLLTTPAAARAAGVGLRLRFRAAAAAVAGACCGDNELACEAAAVGDAPPPPKPLLNVLRADGGDLQLIVVVVRV